MSTFPTLRLIAIQSSRPDKLYRWLKEVCQKLAGHGLWGSFEKIVIRKEDEGNTKVAERTVILKDQVHEWLDSISGEIVPNHCAESFI